MYAFIHIPKTAGSTLRHILRRSFSGQHCDVKVPKRRQPSHEWFSADDLHRLRRVYPRLAGICGHRVTCFGPIAEAADDIRFFTFLRDPSRRFVSHFYHAHRRTERVEREHLVAFCNDSRQRNVQTRWLGGSDNPRDAIRALDERIGFTGLTESFDESFVLFRRWLADERLQDAYGSRNVAGRPPALPIFEDPELGALVRAANTADEEVYRHAVDVIYPRQRAAYGPALGDDVAALRQRNDGFVDPPEPLWGKLKRDLVYKTLLYLGRL